jgi:superfamily II DNA/RNA helicase
MQKKTMDALHAGDTHALYQEMERPYRANQHTLLELAGMYVKDNEGIEERITYFASEYKKYALTGDKGAEEEFFKKLQNEKRKKDIRDELSRRITTFGEPADPTRVKWAVFENDIRQRILSAPASKWLIFNDHASAVYDAAERLRAVGIKCTTLDGGNATAIQRAIDAYKGDEAQVLLLNSKLEAVGMNLENTTHLLFMHATRPQYVEQIVGRAQRYGRPGRLHIVGLFNRSEDPTGST